MRFARTAPVDCLAALALAGVALLPLGSSYAGRSWLVIGLIAAGIGVSVAICLRAVRLGLSAIVGILFVSYVLLAGPIALHGAGSSVAALGPAMIEEVALGTYRAWGDLIGTHAVVDAEGAVMLIPFLLGLAAAGLSAGAALTRNRAWIGTPPPLAALALTLLLGRPEPSRVLLTGALMAAGVIAWTAYRGWMLPSATKSSGTKPSGTKSSVPPAGFSPTRAVSAVLICAVAALIALPLGPRLTGTERWVLRDSARTPALSGLNTPLQDFRAYTLQPPGVADNVFAKALLDVEGLPVGQRLRFATLDTYVDGAWRVANDTDTSRRDDRFLRMPSRLDNPAPGRSRRFSVRVLPAWHGVWVPTAGALQAFDLVGAERTRKLDSLRYNPATRTALLPDGLSAGDRYTLTVRLGPERLEPTMTPWPTADPALEDASAFVDVYAQAWATRAIADGARTDLEVLFEVARQLRQRGRYTDGGGGWERQFRPGHDPTRLGPDFLAARRMAGNDEQYAATMALLANRLGIPARVAVGATVPQSGRIQGRDVSAWVEVRIADGSWRVLPTRLFMSHRPVKRSDAAPPPVTLPVNPPVAPPTAPDTGPDPQESPSEEAQEGEESGEDSTETQADRTEADRDSAGLPARRWLLVAGIGAVGWMLPLIKVIRRSRRRRRGPPSRQVAAAWQEVVDAARDLGVRVPAGLTRPAQAAHLPTATTTGPPQTLALTADAVIFAAEPPTAADAAAYWQQARLARRALTRSRPRWRRALAPLSPASLR